MQKHAIPNSDCRMGNVQSPPLPLPLGSRPGDRLIRLPELLSLVGVSRATAYRYLASGKLPAPIRLSSRCVAWKASTINEWIAGLQAA